MGDRPIPARISLPLLDDSNSGVDFIGLANTLYTANLIFEQPQELRRSKEAIELSIIFRDIDSYENWLNHKTIVDLWSAKFNDLLSARPRTIQEAGVIIECDNVRNCVCSNSDFYILQGRSIQFNDELICNRCLAQVSYSKVPLEIELENWQRMHGRIYLNWLDSGLLEEEALLELLDYKDGKINKEGQRIRMQLADHFNIPVYLSYFVEDSIGLEQCPCCGMKGRDSGLSKYNRMCDSCDTVFGNDEL